MPTDTNSIQVDITAEQVNHELKRKKSPEVLTALFIEEVKLTDEQQRDMQQVLQVKDTFRKFYIRFKTVSGRSDIGDNSHFVRSQLAFTPEMVADNVIRALTYHQLPKVQRQALDHQRLRKETNLVFILALATFVITFGIGWVGDHVDSSSLFFQYATQVRASVSAITVVAIAYFYINPSPGRRGYHYALMGFALAWLAAMVITVL